MGPRATLQGVEGEVAGVLGTEVEARRRRLRNAEGARRLHYMYLLSGMSGCLGVGLSVPRTSVSFLVVWRTLLPQFSRCTCAARLSEGQYWSVADANLPGRLKLVLNAHVDTILEDRKVLIAIMYCTVKNESEGSKGLLYKKHKEGPWMIEPARDNCRRLLSASYLT
jgi:hypothetical protein